MIHGLQSDSTYAVAYWAKIGRSDLEFKTRLKD